MNNEACGGEPGSGQDDARGTQTPLRKCGSPVVDIHCHLHVPAAEALIRAGNVPKPELLQFSNPLTEEVNAEQFREIGKKLVDVDQRLVDMDVCGIDVQAVSPSPAQYYYSAEPELGLQAARIVNDGIARAISAYPDRFVGMGTVPLQAPHLAIAEMDRCRRELGFRGIEIGTNVRGRELSEPELLPFFAAAEELGMLLFLHPLGFTHGCRMCNHYFNNVIGNPLESTLAVGHLIFEGVLEQLPGLKICVAHGGGYIAAYPGRMDHAWRARRDCRQHLPQRPSDYLKRLYFDTVVFDPRELDALMSYFGSDHLCLGTDYPFDMSEPDPARLLAGIGDADYEMIVSGTALKLLGIAVADTY